MDGTIVRIVEVVTVVAPVVALVIVVGVWTYPRSGRRRG